MNTRIGLLLLAASWGCGFIPAALIRFEDRTVQSNLFELAPAIAAMLAVTAVLFGLSAYLKRSVTFPSVAAVSAAVQGLPVFTISQQNAKLIGDYAQLSGVDTSGSVLPPGSFELFPSPWLLVIVSLLLGISLAAEALKRVVSRRIPRQSEGQQHPESATEPDLEADLWKSQLLESRLNKKDKHAR